MSKCVICNKEVTPETAHKAKYVVHEKCFRKVAPNSSRLTTAKQKMGDLTSTDGITWYPEQKTGDEPV